MVVTSTQTRFGPAPGKKALLAALDGSPASAGVLQAALGLGRLIGADVEALHVSDGQRGARIAATLAAGAGVPLRQAHGPVADEILGALRSDASVAAVMGTRAFGGGPRPAGSVAHAVITAMTKPAIFVAPDAHRMSPEPPIRLLVPLDGSPAASTSFLAFERGLLRDTAREVTVLLTFDDVMPPMLDRPTRDLPEWGRDFVHRHCPGKGRSFAWRSGDPGDAVIDVARQTDSDLIVLSFGGNLDFEHGSVIREVLARSAVPVLLLPLHQGSPRHDRSSAPDSSVPEPGILALR